MDGFDDLLAPSRQVLEENPFEDPFSKRSNSPDPWASFHQTYTDLQNAESTSTTTGSFVSAQTDQLEDGFDDSERNKHTHLTVSTSPPIDEDDLPLALSASRRGFMESVSTESYPASATSPTVSEALAHPPSIPSTLEPTTPPPTLPTPRQSSTSPSPTSPLDQSAPNTRALAALTIGGETLGGWQAAQSPLSEQPFRTHDSSIEDSDDDKPLRRTSTSSERTVPAALVPTETKTTTTTTQPRTETGLQPVFVITVDDPQKVGDPIRSFTMYTVHTRTTSPLFQKSSFSVLRRYSDFLWLYETLSNNNPGVVVPPVPEKNSFGRFDQNFVRQRRLALEKCIQKTANHPELGKDPDLKFFLESDNFALDMKHRKAEIANERGGLMASIGQSIAGPRFYETDDWFDRQKAYLDSLESQLRGLVKAIEQVARCRSDIAVATGEFAQTVGDLGSSDVGKQLSLSFSGLAEVQRIAQEIQSAQSEQDMVTIMGTVDEYARLINSVRLAFASRIRIYHALQSADNDVRRVKQAHERNRSQGRIPPERLGSSLNQIAEAERRALEAKHDFDHVSKLVKSEIARFEQERILDFKESLTQFLHGMITRQKQIIGAWEIYQQSLLKSVGVSRSNASSSSAASTSSASP